jgi:putative phosphoribosyl transferase
MWTYEARGFRDRHAAGKLLARELATSGALGESPGGVVVVGLARGGVEVAAEVAASLDAPLDALAVRKVGHPWQPEYGIGAVAPGGVRFIRSHDGLTEEQVAEAVHAAEVKAKVLDAGLHERVARVPVADATCVLVDDGLATGGTMLAAILWARAQGARRVVVAVPVGAAATVRGIAREDGVDAVVCPVTPLEFGAVGFWYDDFHQVSDEDVASLLLLSRDGVPATASAEIAAGEAVLPADLTAPPDPVGWVVFAHGSGSSRRSPRNLQVASVLHGAGIATLLFDLLTTEEELDRRNVFDVELLAARLVAATHWLAERPEARELPVAYFGASTGAAAALLAAAELGGDAISAVVSRGGRPDLAGPRLAEVRSPTLLVVGGADPVVLELNRASAALLTCQHELVVVHGATHLFEEPGALEHVASVATSWFAKQFALAAHRLPAHDE